LSPWLTLRARDNDFFYRYVQIEGKIEKLISLDNNIFKTEAQIALRDNAKAFYKELSRWTQEKLQDLSEMMVNLATLVVISTPNFNSAYRIFSVLNSRGLPLAPADIFKSWVIGEIPQNSQKSYTTTWEDYEQALGRAEFGKLFRDIRTIYTLEKSTKNLLQEFSEKVLNSYLEKGDGIEFMEEILIPYAHAAEHLMTQKS